MCIRILLQIISQKMFHNKSAEIVTLSTYTTQLSLSVAKKNLPSPALNLSPSYPTYSNQYCCPIIQCQCFLFLYRVGNEDKPKSIDSTSLCSDFFNRSYFVSETSQLAKMMQHWGKDGWFSIGLVAVKTNHVFLFHQSL